jgi:hypothetical protein
MQQCAFEWVDFHVLRFIQSSLSDLLFEDFFSHSLCKINIFYIYFLYLFFVPIKTNWRTYLAIFLSFAWAKHLWVTFVLHIINLPRCEEHTLQDVKFCLVKPLTLFRE